MGKSDYLEVNLLNHVLRATPYSAPATVYLAAYTAAPSDAGGGTEVSGGSYTRQTVVFGPPSGNQVANAAEVVFPIAADDWGTLVHFGIFDAPVGGNLLYATPFAAARTIESGDQLRIPVGQLVVSED